ncbi:MAG: acyl-CoA dehydrogenase family protein [Chloroflexi bacterium]|nr:acyl-CoA dehydrogenase family protein [Chloroflexota bacterium]
MDWDDTTEQAQFRNDVRTFIESNLPEYYQKRRERDAVTGEDDWQNDFVHGNASGKAAAREWADKMSERSWVAPHWPQEYGGAGLTTMEQFIFNQEMALAQAPMVGGQGLSLLGPTVLVHGTPEQREEFLAPTLRGEMLWSQGFSEPGAGSDLASLQTRAVRDGDEFIINGQKMWTSTAHKSNYLFGMFRTDPDAPKHRGITFMVMPQENNGISVRPIISMGWDHATNETFFEDVHVPVKNVIGELNRGWYVGMTLLDFERSNIAGAVTVRRRLQSLVDYLDTPEGEQRSQHRRQRNRTALADRWIESEVLFNFSFRIISMQSQGIIPNYEASTSKIFSSELIQRTSNTGMKVFGLYANIWDREHAYTPLDARFTQLYVHSVVLTIFGGSNEIQRNIIATRGLALPRS